MWAQHAAAGKKKERSFGFYDVVLGFDDVVLGFDDVVLGFDDVVLCFDDVMRSRHDVIYIKGIQPSNGRAVCWLDSRISAVDATSRL